MSEKVQIDYNHQTTYDITPLNQVGTDEDFLDLYPSDTPLRTVPTPGGDIAYVRKFGTDYLIKQVTDITDPVDANMTFTVKATDGTTLGSRTGGGAFSAGSTLSTAQASYMEISASGGDVTVLASITIDTDVDAGGLAFTCAAETIYDGNTLTLYLSDTGSTYYDDSYIYGGARHTPVLNNSRKPYLTIASAYAVIAASNDDGIEILDSATYDEDLTTDNQALDSTQTTIYPSSEQYPIITGGIGTRITREVSAVFNNANAIFFNENGSNTDAGATGYEDTWHDPYATIANAKTAAAAKGVSYIIYGGIDATVNNGNFNESTDLDANYTIEPEYGYKPRAYKTTNPGGSDTYVFRISSGAVNIYGWDIDGNDVVSTPLCINIATYTGSICDNEIHGSGDYVATGSSACIGITAIYTFSGNVLRNNIYDSFRVGFLIDINGGTGNFNYNIIYNCDFVGAWFYQTNANSIDIQNNLFYNNGDSATNYYGGLYYNIINATAHTGVIQNNTFFNNYAGIISNINAGATQGTIRNNISYSNTLYDLYKYAATAVTITDSNYGTNSGWTIGANCITTDPEFINDTSSPYNLALSPKSGACHTDSNDDNMGFNFRIIEIDADDIVINGIKIDGQDQFNNAIFIRDTADHTGLNVKWCNIYDFQGSTIDLFDDDTDIEAIISNNFIHDSGNGIALHYNNNTINENIISNNTIQGIYNNSNDNTFNHNILYANQYGIYFDSETYNIIFKNNIINRNYSFGVYSEVFLTIIYCCITDNYNSNVTILDGPPVTNITDEPLFNDVNNNDFRLKRIERGNIIESPCLDIADDGYDMGAYLETALVANDSWDKYTCVNNPSNLNEEQILTGVIEFEDIIGNTYNYMESDRIVLPFQFVKNQYTSEAQRLKFRYFQTLIPSEQNEKDSSECEFRIKLLPTSFYGSGTGTIDANAKTITDATKTWIENEKKGWWVSIKYTSGSATGTITAATKKLQVAPDPTWTNDEWIGYYFFYNGYYYYIIDNDSDELTLSDPNDTLSNAAGIDWEIDKYFKIESNTSTVLTLTDDNSELVDGSYEYFIDFILCRVLPSSHKYNQSNFVYSQTRNTKGNYEITWREID